MLRKLATAIAVTAAVAGAAWAGPASPAAVSARAALLSCAGAAPWQHAGALVGHVATLRGPVRSTNYASYSNGSPTFLDIGRPYPNEGLSIVIWIENRSAFGRPEVENPGHNDLRPRRRQSLQGRAENRRPLPTPDSDHSLAIPQPSDQPVRAWH